MNDSLLCPKCGEVKLIGQRQNIDIVTIYKVKENRLVLDIMESQDKDSYPGIRCMGWSPISKGDYICLECHSIINLTNNFTESY
ncbi:DNA-directed RNA polymerase subunit RPC12/RpoP [Paenibacillus mucilaginosus]